MKERRYKIVRMDSDLLVNIFNWHLDMPHCIALPITESLPEGTRVVEVHYNHCHRAWDITVEHESFPVVDVTSVKIPAIPDWFDEYRIVRFEDIGIAKVSE